MSQIKNILCTMSSIGLISAALVGAAAAADINADYQQAVEDAAFAEQGELSKQLIAVSPANSGLVWNEDKSRIKVVTWKAQGAFDNFFKPYTKTSDNPEYAVWVTTAPQVKNFCSTYKGEGDKLGLRLKQYLGLNPDWQYDVFVELWVDPKDMFRPCVDPEVSDSQCQLQFGDAVPVVKNIPDYKEFYRDLYYKSFRGSAGVPWTGLGYTYDWGNKKSEVGASEFILVPGAAYEIASVTATEEYCGR